MLGVFILILLYEACLLFVAALAGWGISNVIRIIPTAIIHFPEIAVTAHDFLTTSLVLIAAVEAVFLLGRMFAKGTLFVDAARTSYEIYGLFLGLAIGSVCLYLLTDAVFSPELLLDTALVSLVLFVLSHVMGSAWFGGDPPGRALGKLFGALFRHLRSPAAIAIILVAVAPMIVARLYTTSRDFANFVTRIHETITVSASTEYQLTNAFPGTLFLQPIDVQFSPDGTPIAYVLERSGKLWRIGLDGSNKEMLIDFSNHVGVVEVENGALGFALHPQFGRTDSPNRNFVYIYYTDATVPGRQINRLVRFDLGLPTPAARASSETPLIEFNRDPDGFHNAGSVEFGPDGFLYIAIGEGEDRENYQRIDHNLLGGIFRIDVDMRGGTISHPISRQPANGTTKNYMIPNDNPFVGVPGALEEYWALGFRNPFRMSFDPKTGKLWIGDVGSDEWEEVDIGVAGGNYQYPYIEGVSPQKGFTKPAHIVGKEIGPLYYYHHTATDRDVIGGTVYRGDKFPDLKGKYIFADDYSGRVYDFSADLASISAGDVKVVARSTQVAQYGLTKMINAPNGDFFLTAIGSLYQPNGQVLKLAPAGTAPSQNHDVENMPQVAVNGREIFSENCSRCHGPNGDGNGPDLKGAGVKMPNFTDPAYVNRRTLQDVENIIRKGGQVSGLNPLMPSWQDILKDQEIAAVAQYVRSIGQKH